MYLLGSRISVYICYGFKIKKLSYYLQKLEKFVIYDYISLNLEPAQVSIKFTIVISIDKAY
jgi:hypothetical protein